MACTDEEFEERLKKEDDANVVKLLTLYRNYQKMAEEFGFFKITIGSINRNFGGTVYSTYGHYVRGYQYENMMHENVAYTNVLRGYNAIPSNHIWNKKGFVDNLFTYNTE